MMIREKILSASQAVFFWSNDKKTARHQTYGSGKNETNQAWLC